MSKKLGILALAGALLLTASADARRRKNKKDQPAKGLAPEIQEVLGQGYTMLPELSDRIQPGVVYLKGDDSVERLMQGCVTGEPQSNNLTLPSLQSSLAGSVTMRAGGMGGSAAGRYQLKISFLDPHILGYDTIDFLPSADCVQKSGRYAQSHDLGDAYLVQEVLMARINGCEELSAEASVGLPRGGASMSGTQACTLMSTVPVAVGVRHRHLSEIPQLAQLVTPPEPEQPEDEFTGGADTGPSWSPEPDPSPGPAAPSGGQSAAAKAQSWGVPLVQADVSWQGGDYSLQRLMSGPGVQLHWLEGLWGTLQVEEIEGSYVLDVSVSDAGEGFTLRGILTDIDAGGFGFKGSFSTQVSHIAGGMNCQRGLGDYRFGVYPGGTFWRLAQMDHPCGRATDYWTSSGSESPGEQTLLRLGRRARAMELTGREVDSRRELE